MRLVVSLLLFVLALGLPIYRVTGVQPVRAVRLAESWLMVDFRQIAYYPSRAFLDGLNPYNSSRYMERYPVARPVTLYAPAVFILCAPFGVLPLGLSGVVYFILTVLLTVILGWAVLRLSGSRPGVAAVAVASAVLLLSRPGHWNLMSGQITLIVVLASYAALSFARHTPPLSGLGLAIALLKPTFGAPLVLALLARGAGRAVGWGLGIAAVLNVPVAIVLVRREGGLAPFLATLVQSYRSHATNPENGIHAISRIDLVGFVSRLLHHPLGASGQVLLGLAVLVPMMLVSWRLAEATDAPRRRAVDAVVYCSVLLSIYHQAYDLLLLALPAAALVVGAKWPPRATHVVQAVLFGFLALNYLARDSALAALGLVPGYRLAVVSANSLAVLALFGLYLAEAGRLWSFDQRRSADG
jgi:hypothetical protein